MTRLLAVCCSFVTLFGISLLRAEDIGPATDVPELKVLQHYVGTWDVDLTGNGSGSGEATAKWILGGRFLEQAGVIHSDDDKDVWVTTLFTFDTQTTTYRCWTFLSTGVTNQGEMTWDEKSRTMTSVMRPDSNGVRTTNTADFSESGKERWRFVYTDRDGKQVGEMGGENTLRKSNGTQPTKSVVAKSVVELTAEQKPLDRFLGTWHTDYRLPKSEWIPEETTGSGEMVFTRELGGQMVRERTQHSDGTEGTFLMTYDFNGKQYRAWWFSSTGQFNDSTGEWDETAKAFTWKQTDSNGLGSKAQHRFVNDKLDWTVLVENPQKVVMFHMDGTSQRVTNGK